MKTKMVVLGSLVAIVLAGSYNHSIAEAKSKKDKSGLNIGIVSVLKIFQNCERNKTYGKEISAEQRRIVAILEKIAAEVEAEKRGLDTLKAGSDEHMEGIKEILQKQAHLKSSYVLNLRTCKEIIFHIWLAVASAGAHPKTKPNLFTSPKASLKIISWHRVWPSLHH